ncbi:PspA/IM30 family protein [Reichenbachiella versicolor]|uniref:PspA/IM30 family protein n=1 Tax=Reichenbachiella versicolor TaxID=1821036 RepID=UPI000D6E732E|nr:PspA/IM30 family protein [Reichenbachiella versicolor]
MNVFKRLFKIGEAETQSAIDKLEDPIKMTEQGIRDLKKDLDNSLKSFAEVKAMAIRAKNDVDTHKSKAEDYESKAILLLKKAQSGDLDASEADRLASEALTKKEEATAALARSQKEKETFDKNVEQLDVNIKELKSTISSYENELKTLKARVKVSEASAKVNKQMAQIDSTSTVSMLEKMKDKVAQQEALAEAYGDISTESKTIDQEIDKALGGSSAKANDDLAALKAKLGMDKE